MEHTSPFYSNSNTFQSQLITNPTDSSPYDHLNHSPNRHVQDQDTYPQHHSQVISQTNGNTQRYDDQFRVDPFRETAVSTVIQTNSHRDRPLSNLHVDTNALDTAGSVEVGKTSGHSRPSEFLSPTHQSKILFSQKENLKDEREEILSPEIYLTRKKTDALLKSIILKYGLDSAEEAYRHPDMSNPTVTTDVQSQRPALSTVTNSYVNQQAGRESLNEQNGDRMVYVSPLKTERAEENIEHSVYRSPEENLKKAGNGGFHSNHPYRHSFDDHHQNIKGAFRGYSENKWQNRHSEAFQMQRYSHADGNTLHFSTDMPKMSFRDPSHREDKDVAFNKFYNEIMSTMSPLPSVSIRSHTTHKKAYNHMTETVDSKQDYENTHHYDNNGEGLLKSHHKRAESGMIMPDIYIRPYTETAYHHENNEGVEFSAREGHFVAEELNRHVSPHENTYNHMVETVETKPNYMELEHGAGLAHHVDTNLYYEHHGSNVGVPVTGAFTSPYENHLSSYEKTYNHETKPDHMEFGYGTNLSSTHHYDTNLYHNDHMSNVRMHAVDSPYETHMSPHENAYHHMLESAETKPAYMGAGHEATAGTSSVNYHYGQKNAISRFVSPDHREILYRDHNIRLESNERTPNVDVFLSPYENHVSLDREVATSDFGRHVSPSLGSYQTHDYSHIPGETRPGAAVYGSTYQHDNNVYPGFTSSGHREELYHGHITRPESNVFTGSYDNTTHYYKRDEGVEFSVREREIVKDDIYRDRPEEENRRVYRLPSEEPSREEFSREEFNYYEDDAIRQRRHNESPKKSSPIAHLKRELVTFGPESDREEVKSEEKQLKSHHIEEKKEIKAIKVVEKKKSNVLVYVVVFGLVISILAWLGIILFYPEEESLY